MQHIQKEEQLPKLLPLTTFLSPIMECKTFMHSTTEISECAPVEGSEPLKEGLFYTEMCTNRRNQNLDSVHQLVHLKML